LRKVKPTICRTLAESSTAKIRFIVGLPQVVRNQ
jgi:hypothetical protein